MMFNTRIEFEKYNKTQNLEKNIYGKVKAFVYKCITEQRANLKGFDQLGFYDTCKGQDENVDKFIEYLKQEYTKYDIKDKTIQEIKDLINDYLNSLNELNDEKLLPVYKVSIIVRTFNLKETLSKKDFYFIIRQLEQKVGIER